MGLTPTTRAAIERARSAGGGTLGQQLSDEVCNFLLATVVRDLELRVDGYTPPEIPVFFSVPALSVPQLPAANFAVDLERVLLAEPTAETYFLCLAALHKSRMKYESILRRQPIPTIDQVGPRSLLQYGLMSATTLAAFVIWRKWLFDIDNRAAQETGYLFEPIIAHAIGGSPFSAARSPIRRSDAPTKGRQVDCIREGRAYEIKIRVTIAASGQGRWREELSFPLDCRSSGYAPVLVVLDPTTNPKLDELVRAFEAQGGETYVGDAAWEHLEAAAGEVMAFFLERYVRTPISTTFATLPGPLPAITFEMRENEFRVLVGGEVVVIPRECAIDVEDDTLPEDVDEEVPGV
jgi:hypothetical protein